jgi:hypothetical protein
VIHLDALNYDAGWNLVDEPAFADHLHPNEHRTPPADSTATPPHHNGTRRRRHPHDQALQKNRISP